MKLKAIFILTLLTIIQADCSSDGHLREFVKRKRLASNQQYSQVASPRVKSFNRNLAANLLGHINPNIQPQMSHLLFNNPILQSQLLAGHKNQAFQPQSFISKLQSGQSTFDQHMHPQQGMHTQNMQQQQAERASQFISKPLRGRGYPRFNLINTQENNQGLAAPMEAFPNYGSQLGAQTNEDKRKEQMLRFSQRPRKEEHYLGKMRKAHLKSPLDQSVEDDYSSEDLVSQNAKNKNYINSQDLMVPNAAKLYATESSTATTTTTTTTTTSTTTTKKPKSINKTSMLALTEDVLEKNKLVKSSSAADDAFIKEIINDDEFNQLINSYLNEKLKKWESRKQENEYMAENRETKKKDALKQNTRTKAELYSKFDTGRYHDKPVSRRKGYLKETPIEDEPTKNDEYERNNQQNEMNKDFFEKQNFNNQEIMRNRDLQEHIGSQFQRGERFEYQPSFENQKLRNNFQPQGPQAPLNPSNGAPFYFNKDNIYRY